MTNYSDKPEDIIKNLVQEGMAARASYQIWSALRKQESFDQYEEILTGDDYKAFFNTSSSTHFKLIFISLGKIFDSDSRTSSIETLKKALEKADRVDLVTHIEEKLGNRKQIRERIKKIRHQSIAHNQGNLSKEEIYKTNSITPDELCCFIDETCEVINYLASVFGLSTMFMSDRVKQSTLKVLSALTAVKDTDKK